MKRNIILLLVVSLIVLSLGTLAMAQPKNVPERPQKPLIGKDGEFVEVLWLWELTKALNLNEEKLALLIPKLKKFNDLRKETAQARKKTLFELRDALKNNKDDATIEAILGKLDKLEKDFLKQREAIEQEIKSVLTVKEWAQYILLRENFERKLKAFLLNNAKLREEKPPKKR